MGFMDEDDELKALEAEQASATRKKGYLNALGGVMDNFQSIPGSHELLWGGKTQSPTASKNLGAIADTLTDPMDRKKKAYEFIKNKREATMASAADSPESPDSIAMADQVGGMFPQFAKYVKGKSKTQIAEMMPLLSQKARGDEDRALREQEMNAKRDERKDARADRLGVRADALALKAAEKDEKKKTSMSEVETRRRNIEDNLGLLETMIKDKGTYEAFGSHNSDLDRRVEAIATDMAKLADPESVARPAEVEAFKKGLVRASATDMTNETALEILKNFRGEVGSRAANAYKVRGLTDPSGEKIVGGGDQLTPQERAQAALERKLKAKQTAGQ